VSVKRVCEMLKNSSCVLWFSGNVKTPDEVVTRDPAHIVSGRDAKTAIELFWQGLAGWGIGIRRRIDDRKPKHA